MEADKQEKYMSEPGDCETDIIPRRWTNVAQRPDSLEDAQPLKIMHWNILAQRLADAFDKIHDDAPMLKWENRQRLFQQHIEQVDPDVFACSEIDAVSGRNGQEIIKLIKMMQGLGYSVEYFEKSNYMSASGIFYKKDKIQVVESGQVVFEPGGSQFFMYGTFCLKDAQDYKFVVGETHLKAKKPNMAARVTQVESIVKFFETYQNNLPVFMAGDFNEEPQNAPIQTMETQFVDLFTIMNQQIGKDAKYPSFTTYKYRAKDGGWVEHTIDYIFMQKNDYFNKHGACFVESHLNVDDIINENLRNEVIGNPCPDHPSDHYSLAYKTYIFKP